MEINVFKEQENIYFSVDGGSNQLMNFDNLVNLAEKIVNLKDKYVINVKCDNGSLELYRSTIEEMINSILNDTELLELLQEKN